MCVYGKQRGGAAEKNSEEIKRNSSEDNGLFPNEADAGQGG